MATGMAAGSTLLMPQIPAASPSWLSATQPRRLPMKGKLKRSSSGAHRNLNE